MKNKYIQKLIYIAISLSAVSASAQVPHLPPDGVEIALPMRRLRLLDDNATETIPQESELNEVLRVGARALAWVNRVQSNVPEESREQVWRRIDNVGHEPTWEQPKLYNAATLLQQYREVMNGLSPTLQDVLRSEVELPNEPPSGESIHSIVLAARALRSPYTTTARWKALYTYRHSLSPERRDVRGVLSLIKYENLYRTIIQNWSQERYKSQRADVLSAVAATCPLLERTSVAACVARYRTWLADDSAGPNMDTILNEALRGGREELERRFSLQLRQDLLKPERSGSTTLLLPTRVADNTIFSWMREYVRRAWTGIAGGDHGRSLQILLTQTNSRDSVRVDWQAGQLPHVNAVGGSRVVMDANTARWLEFTQVVIAHEFGHVIGFADCYVEFWSEPQQAFLYYAIDPSNAMCALSGAYQPRHFNDLNRVYLQSSHQIN